MNRELVKASFRVFFRVRGAVLGPLVLLAIMFAVEGSFWWSVSRSSGDLGGYGARGIILYVFAALLVSQITACSGEPDSLSAKIESGRLDAFLLRPTDLFRIMASIQLGMCAARAVTLLPVLFGLELWLAEAVTPARLFWLPPLLSMGALLNLLVNSTISNLTFVFRDSYAFVVLKETLFWVLSGALIPLDLFPGWVRGALTWFPPAYVVYFPTKVALGQEDGGQVLLVGLSFLALAAVTFQVSFRLGVRRYQAFGG